MRMRRLSRHGSSPFWLSASHCAARRRLRPGPDAANTLEFTVPGGRIPDDHGVADRERLDVSATGTIGAPFDLTTSGCNPLFCRLAAASFSVEGTRVAADDAEHDVPLGLGTDVGMIRENRSSHARRLAKANANLLTGSTRHEALAARLVDAARARRSGCPCRRSARSAPRSTGTTPHRLTTPTGLVELRDTTEIANPGTPLDIEI